MDPSAIANWCCASRDWIDVQMRLAASSKFSLSELRLATQCLFSFPFKFKFFTECVNPTVIKLENKLHLEMRRNRRTTCEQHVRRVRGEEKCRKRNLNAHSLNVMRKMMRWDDDAESEREKINGVPINIRLIKHFSRENERRNIRKNENRTHSYHDHARACVKHWCLLALRQIPSLKGSFTFHALFFYHRNEWAQECRMRNKKN